MQGRNKRKYSPGWKRKVRNTATASTLLLTVAVVLVLSFWKHWEYENSAHSGEEYLPEATISLPGTQPTQDPVLSGQPSPEPVPSVYPATEPMPSAEPDAQEPLLFSELRVPMPTISVQEPFVPVLDFAAAWEDTPGEEERLGLLPDARPGMDLELPVKAALLMDAETGKVLYGYHAAVQITPASVTKLMTVLLALEQGELSDVLTVTDSALDVGHWDAVMCGFRSGDQVTLYDVLHGMLLSSGNDAAEIVAEYVSGSVEEFVKLMNERAAELGAKHTNFANPHGLPNDEHLTSAYDISLVMRELLKHEEFFEISSKKSYKAYYENANGMAVSLTFQNTNQYMAGKYELLDGIELLGGKTGTTNKAGKCLALFVRAQNGNIYLAEVFGAETLDDLYFLMNQLLGIID